MHICQQRINCFDTTLPPSFLSANTSIFQKYIKNQFIFAAAPTLKRESSIMKNPKALVSEHMTKTKNLINNKLMMMMEMITWEDNKIVVVDIVVEVDVLDTSLLQQQQNA